VGSIKYLLLYSYFKEITLIRGPTQIHLFYSFFRKINFICGISQMFVVVFLFQRNHLHQRVHSNIFCVILILEISPSSVGSIKYLFHSNICCFILTLEKSPSSVGSIKNLLSYSYFRKITLKYLLLYSYLRKITFICGITPDRTTLFASG